MKAFVLSVILCWIVYMPVMSDGKVQVGADRLEEWLADLLLTFWPDGRHLQLLPFRGGS